MTASLRDHQCCLPIEVLGGYVCTSSQQQTDDLSMAIVRTVHQRRIPMIVTEINVSAFRKEDTCDSRVSVLSGYRQCRRSIFTLKVYLGSVLNKDLGNV